MTNNFTPAFLVHRTSVRYLYIIAHDYATAALDLYGNNQHMHTYHYLSSTAIELYIKTIEASNVCVKYKNKNSAQITDTEIVEAIQTRLGIYKHDLTKLLGGMYKVKKDLAIKAVMKIRNPANTKFIDEWQIIFNDNTEFFLKTLEGVRYGSFSKQPNVLILTQSDKVIHDFLLKLDIYVSNEMESAKNHLHC